MIGTSSYDDKGKSTKLNKHSNGKCVICSGIPAAQNIVVDKTCINDAQWIVSFLLFYCYIFSKKDVCFFTLNIYLLKWFWYY